MEGINYLDGRPAGEQEETTDNEKAKIVEPLFPLNNRIEEQEATTDYGNSEIFELLLSLNDIVEEQEEMADY